jgi:hypothetical protein
VAPLLFATDASLPPVPLDPRRWLLEHRMQPLALRRANGAAAGVLLRLACDADSFASRVEALDALRQVAGARGPSPLDAGALVLPSAALGDLPVDASAPHLALSAAAVSGVQRAVCAALRDLPTRPQLVPRLEHALAVLLTLYSLRPPQWPPSLHLPAAFGAAALAAGDSSGSVNRVATAALAALARALPPAELQAPACDALCSALIEAAAGHSPPRAIGLAHALNALSQAAPASMHVRERVAVEAVARLCERALSLDAAPLRAAARAGKGVENELVAAVKQCTARVSAQAVSSRASAAATALDCLLLTDAALGGGRIAVPVARALYLEMRGLQHTQLPRDGHALTTLLRKYLALLPRDAPL